MDHQVDIGDQKEACQEEEEEAISLSDFPMGATCQSINICRSSSEPTTDLFEFFSSDDLSSSMSNAEDIISGGKLVPFKEQQPPPQTQSFHHRRSESMSDLKSTCISDESKARIMQSSRSLDYRSLRRVPSIAVADIINRNSSVRSSSSRYDSSSNQKGAKPPWYVFMLGLAKFPVEMELKDIKNRQVRQTPATMFGGSGYPVKRKRSWDLLRVLSCKGPSSVAVVSTTGFGLMPQACHTSYS